MARLAVLISLFAIFARATAEFHPPAMLVSRASSVLKPRIGKAIQGKGDSVPAVNPLARLLLIRQTTGCPSGYSECTGALAGQCCPSGGECCSSSQGCCDFSQFCYGNGCCDLTDFGCSGNTCCPLGSNCCSGGGCCSDTDQCVVVDGQLGCCPIGETCSGTPSGCALPGYDPCPSADYCCPTGDTCLSTGSGLPTCSGPGGTVTAGGGGGGGTSTPASSHSTSTSTSHPSTVSPSATFQSTQIPSSSLSSSANVNEHPFTQSFPSSGNSAGATNNTVSATDPRVIYDGSSWASSSACGGSAKTATTAGDSLTFQFLGTAIFINSVVGPSAGVFSVNVDGSNDIDDVDGFSSGNTGCEINWSSFGLDNTLHTIIVTFKGASTGANSGASSSSFQFANFIVTTPGTSTGTTSVLNPSVTSVQSRASNSHHRGYVLVVLQLLAPVALFLWT